MPIMHPPPRPMWVATRAHARDDQGPGDQGEPLFAAITPERQARASWRASSVSSCTSARLPSSFSPKRQRIVDRSCRSRRGARVNSLAPAWPTIRAGRADGAVRRSPRRARLAMIRYALACDQGHAFESWFANSAPTTATSSAPGQAGAISRCIDLRMHAGRLPSRAGQACD
jgi:hypothetical protein